MVVSFDDVVIKEVQLSKDKTTLGRRPYNDIVIDNLAVSGEHALLHMEGNEVLLEDLNSTNGTYVNGKAIKKQALQHGDHIDIGKYKIRYLADGATATATALPSTPLGADSGKHAPASIKVLSGTAMGREVVLTKEVTTVGKPAVAVAAITRRDQGYVVHHVDGGGNPRLNGRSITAEPLDLKDGDLIELAGTQMQFLQP